MLTLAAVLAGLAVAIPLRRVHAHALNRARDWWLAGLLLVLVPLLATQQLALGLMALAVLVHWRSPAQLPAVLTWAGIIATWLVVAAVPGAALEALVMVWRVVVVAQILLAAWQRAYGWDAVGTLAQRSLLAALLALVVPFAGPWEWPLYVVGFALTWSWLALLAAAVGLALRWPVAAPWLALAGGLVVALTACRWSRERTVDRLRRNGTLDGLRTRWTLWRATLRLRPWTVWLVGRGPGDPAALDTAEMDVARAFVARGTRALSPFHCEPLELAYTYGALAIAAMLALVWQAAPRLMLGDPWSAAVVAGAVLACGTIPCRVVPLGVPWLVALAVVASR